MFSGNIDKLESDIWHQQLNMYNIKCGVNNEFKEMRIYPTKKYISTSNFW